MRKRMLLATLLLSAPALAWVPKLDENTAKNVIDGAYGRRDAVITYQTLDLNVKDGQFVSGAQNIKAFAGGEQCLSNWLGAPNDYKAGSRPATVTLSGQADALYFQAVDARDNFKNLSAAAALTDEYSSKRLADGLLRVDVFVRGLPSEKARDAYMLRLRGKDDKLVAPVKRSYVSDWKPMTPPAEGGATATGPLQGTLVYYFEPLKAGIGASDAIELLLRTEADSDCAYSLNMNLGSFQ